MAGAAAVEEETRKLSLFSSLTTLATCVLATAMPGFFLFRVSVSVPQKQRNGRLLFSSSNGVDCSRVCTAATHCWYFASLSWAGAFRCGRGFSFLRFDYCLQVSSSIGRMAVILTTSSIPEECRVVMIPSPCLDSFHILNGTVESSPLNRVRWIESRDDQC